MRIESEAPLQSVAVLTTVCIVHILCFGPSKCPELCLLFITSAPRVAQSATAPLTYLCPLKFSTRRHHHESLTPLRLPGPPHHVFNCHSGALGGSTRPRIVAERERARASSAISSQGFAARKMIWHAVTILAKLQHEYCRAALTIYGLHVVASRMMRPLISR